VSFRTVFLIAVFAVAMFFLSRWRNDPHHTALPFGSTDLSTVQEKLAKLSPEEQTLVKDYVQRSNGDVLPAAMADPDDPLTARTFGEAIELQRRWLVKAGADEARAAEFRAARERKLEPLRAIARASVVKAEIITQNELDARIDPGFYQRAYQVDKSPAFVTQIRVQNLSSDRIVALKGSLQARDTQAYLPMDICWIDIDDQQELPPGGTLDLNCGGRFGVSEQQRAFVDRPPGRFTVEWEPKYIKLGNGRELNGDR
jgi:hypothetical protein